MQLAKFVHADIYAKIVWNELFVHYHTTSENIIG